MTPNETAAKLRDLLNSPDGRDAGFGRADEIEGQPNVLGVEIAGDLFFVEVMSA